MAKSSAQKSLSRPHQPLLNSATGKAASITRKGVIRGDDADQWLRENDPEHGLIHRRRIALPATDAWLEGLADAEPAGLYPVVYFIQAETGGPIKIGWAQSYRGCQQRLRDVQVGNPNELVLRRIVVGRMAQERRLHLRFAELCVRGEWFRAEEPLRTVARAI